MRRRRGALGSAQFCGARARIGRHLCFAGRYGTLGQDLKAWNSLRNFGQMPRSAGRLAALDQEIAQAVDRKSTRLNSSHTVISYAVFCLKKKIVFFEQRGLGRSARGDVARYVLEVNVEALESLRCRRGLGPIVSIGTSSAGVVAVAREAG